MDAKEQLELKNDQILDGSSSKEKTKAELLVELRKAGVDTTTQRFFKPELQDLCRLHGVPLSESKQNIRPGWCNAPKGML